MAEDIRWIQRFQNYKKALEQLNSAVELSRTRELSLLEKQGLIKTFEFTHELAWNLIKDYLEYQGYQDIKGSRDAIREAFRSGIIENGETWMETIQTRNITAHTYDEAIAGKAMATITGKYLQIFNNLAETFEIFLQKEH